MTRIRVLSSTELTLLWRKHGPALLLIARSRCGSAEFESADDCVQEAFIRLATQHPVPDDPAAWLVRVVRNAAIDVVRSQLRRKDRETRAVRERLPWLEPVDVSAMDQPSSEQIQSILLTLEDATREIVVAHLWNNMSFRQIAEAFELSHATTHRKYEAGIAELRTRLVKVPAAIPAN